MVIQICYEFHEILSIAHLVMAQFLLILNQHKGNNSCNTYAILTKLDVHQRIMEIYIHFKFQQIPLVGYLLMALDGCDRQTNMEKTISLHVWQGIKMANPKQNYNS